MGNRCGDNYNDKAPLGRSRLCPTAPHCASAEAAAAASAASSAAAAWRVCVHGVMHLPT